MTCPQQVWVLASVLLTTAAMATDWPAYQHDAARSAATEECLAFPLASTWTYQPLQPPRPAWPEPGRELHRLDFDYSFQPVAAAGKIFFASSANDTVTALDIGTGQMLWRFTAGGPFRFAPTVAEGRIFAASDDGHLYCLEAKTGAAQWIVRVAPGEDQLLGNGRMISRWPLRSGVLVKDHVVYATAGVWPSEGVHVVALEAATGRELWRNAHSGDQFLDMPHPGASSFGGVAPQGYLAATEETLLVPCGRSVPAAFDLKTGALRYYQPAAYQSDGGAWLTVAGTFFFNQRHDSNPDRDVEYGEAGPQPGDGMKAYRVSDGRQVFELEKAMRVVVAGRMLCAAGGGAVAAYDLDALCAGQRPADVCRWSVPHERVYSLAVAGNAVLVGGNGTINALSLQDGKSLWSETVTGQIRGIAVADGRLVLANEKGHVAVFESSEVTVPAQRLREERRWPQTVDGSVASLAGELLRVTGRTAGWALVLGAADAQLAMSLALQSDLRVLGGLTDDATTRAQRAWLLPTGLYGDRVSVQTVTSCLPFAPYFADLVVATGDVHGRAGADLLRVVRPCGGKLVLAMAPGTEHDRLVRETGAMVEGGLWVATRGPLPGAGSWLHQWADAGRTGVGHEERVKLPLRVLWFGGPGPERMMSRHWGTSTPLSHNGRVFVTGQHEILCFDAYNGRILWTLPMEDVGRKNAVRYAANVCADEESLYVAQGTMCFRVDQATGNVRGFYSMPSVPTVAPPSAVSPPRPPSVAADWTTEWTVFGPFPQSHGRLPSETLAKIPEQVENLRPQVIQASNGMLDFTFLRKGSWTSAEMERHVAYAFAKVHVATAGLLRVGVGADYWVQLYLDGQPVFPSEQTGGHRGVATHIADVTVTAGEHVLAALVRAGSMGWGLVIAAGAQYDRFLVPRDEAPLRNREWEYLSVTQDLVLGTTAGGTAVFAAEKQTGALRWVVPAQHSIPSAALALADGRLFYLDEQFDPAQWSNGRRSGYGRGLSRVLIAVDLATGKELWRQGNVPALVGDSPSFVQVSRGMVVANGAFACEAATGIVRWQQNIFCARPPLLYDDWVVAQPFAYHLKTGQRRMVADPLTKEERPWQMARSYGCGSLAGCRNLLLFRSATFGFYDWERGGTANFSGARPNCSVSMMAANGLVLLPEASAGCSCSYNFQTSLALYPDPSAPEPWCVVGGESGSKPVHQLRIHFGAPGDRRDAEGHLWFAFPRPRLIGVLPVPVTVTGDQVTLELTPLPADTRETVPERRFTVRLTVPPGSTWTVGNQSQTATTGRLEFHGVNAGRFLIIKPPEISNGSTPTTVEVMEEKP